MRFESDVFISYAHLDNQELMEGHRGWVANFHRALEIRVSQLLGAHPQIWRDPKLKGSDFFENTLLERLKRVGVLLSVVSPRYLKSDWTRRELLEFWKNAEEAGGLLVNGKSRVFKVMKTPVPVEAQPAQLQKMLGYEFYRIDPETGRVRELDHVFGPEAQRDFWMKVDDVAHDLSALLEALHEADHVPDEPKATVFLAEVTSDLQEEYEVVRRDLLEQGCTVLPTRPLPLRGRELEPFLTSELEQCDLSIHLIGRSYGIVPEGGTSSITELQNEYAIQRGTRGGFTRLLWLPDGLRSDDLRQQIFIDHARSDARVLTGADLLETSIEEFRTVLRARLEQFRPPAPPPVEAPAAAAASAPGAAPGGDLARVYVVCDQRDQDAVGAWTDFLFDQGLEVVPSVFDGDETEVREYHEESLRLCDGVLIYYGAGNEMWLRRKLREVQKSAGYGREQPIRAVGICVAPPMSPPKAQFRTREALLLPQPDGFAPDPLRPFVALLKGEAGARSA
jgi:hypothetical protein